MNEKTLLLAINNAIENLNWNNELQKQRAKQICAYILNQYVYNGYNLSDYISLAHKYFQTICKSHQDAHDIKKVFINSGILECNNSYNITKGQSKGYRFGQTLLSKEVTSTNQTFTSFTASTKVTISYLLPIQYYQGYCVNNLSHLKFDCDIEDYINDLATVKPVDLLINEKVTDGYFTISYVNKEYRYSKAKAIEAARDQGKVLIQHKKNYYIDTADNFITTKSYSQRLSYCYSVFNINNQIFYCDRNNTNNRLDHNLTGLKKGLFSKLTFDGERLHELDIANAQFAIAAHLNPEIDQSFIEQAQAGTLYSTIEEELKLKPKEGKALMFKVAFDKIRKKDHDQNAVRKLYPKYMAWVEAYKKKNGYKAFANLLQRKESEIMIDGLLKQLIEGGYNLFTIHDALRVKQSEVNEIYGITTNYFDQIGFNCHLRKDK